MSFRDQLFCFADFVGLTVLADRFLLPQASYFLSCSPTFFAAVSKVFLPLTTSAISCPADSNKLEPTLLGAGTTYLRRNGFAALPKACASAPSLLQRCRLKLLRSSNGISTWPDTIIF